MRKHECDKIRKDPLHVRSRTPASLIWALSSNGPLQRNNTHENLDPFNAGAPQPPHYSWSTKLKAKLDQWFDLRHMPRILNIFTTDIPWYWISVRQSHGSPTKLFTGSQRAKATFNVKKFSISSELLRSLWHARQLQCLMTHFLLNPRLLPIIPESPSGILNHCLHYQME